MEADIQVKIKQVFIASLEDGIELKPELYVPTPSPPLTRTHTHTPGIMQRDNVPTNSSSFIILMCIFFWCRFSFQAEL